MRFNLPNLTSVEWLMNYNFLVVGGILLGVMIMMGYILLWSGVYSLPESALLEFSWIVLPSILTLFLLLPSLNHVYHSESSDSSISLNSVGHQWYWSYSYSPFQKEFDSFLGSGTYRLLESDNKVVLPFSSSVSVGISSEDVIHSWSLPLLNIKVDGNPGRINSTTFSYPYPGLLYGQCSEICGANHSFMPIEVEFTSTSSFLQWLTI